MRAQQRYTHPQVRTVSAQELVDAMGPAHANHCHYGEADVSGSRMAGHGRR